MMEINKKTPASFGQRCHTLNVAAYAVREQAVTRGCDLDGWRLARSMREANTDTQVNAAERDYGVWLRRPISFQER
jgi:IS5 family transposase